jgi:hypothetical protein
MKKTILSRAVLAGLAGCAMTSAQAAMYINEKGLGEALVYPFYTAENGNDTYIHVVNTTNQAKAVKVRFLESQNSQEVLDFNLYLSAQDHFAFAITATADGGAAIVTADNSCTVPALGTANPPFNGTTVTRADGAIVRTQPFVNFRYANDTDDSIARSQAGYVEVIEMGQLDPILDYAEWVTHGSDGVPADCESLRDLWVNGVTNAADGQWQDDFENANDYTGFLTAWAGGGLYGFGTIINVEDGTAVGFEADAIASLVDLSQNPTGSALHYPPGNTEPDFSDTAIVDQSTLFADGNAVTYTFPNSPVNAVSSLFMAEAIANDYITDPALNAETDWVVTFPTKTFYVNQQDTNGDPLDAVPPFTNRWDEEDSIACEPVGLTYFDREEGTLVVENQSAFSPQPPSVTAPGLNLCKEANVLEFAATSALNASSRLLLGSPLLGSGFVDGWAVLDFTTVSGHALDGFVDVNGTATLTTLSGLPVTGFMAVKYTNSDANEAGALANYGFSVKHKGISVAD